MDHTRIKICGITQLADAVAAAELGADYLGLNFVGGPRRISFEQAKVIMAGKVGRVTWVGLCNGPRGGSGAAREPYYVRSQMSIGCFQMHGWSWEADGTVRDPFGQAFDERGAETTEKALVWWLAAPVAGKGVFGALKKSLAGYAVGKRPAALVLDASVKGQLGGTGQTFDWNWIAEARDAGQLSGLPPIILAGGLTPENVAKAIALVRPFAVDVSSGVEEAGKPGVKDVAKLRDFVQAVRAVPVAI